MRMFFASRVQATRLYIRPALAAVLTVSMLSGCAAVGGQQATADTYDLSAVSPVDVGSVRRGTQILIAAPTALKALDSENIVIRTEPLVIQYLSEAQWSDRLPNLVQRRLADAFTASGQFDGVGLPGQGLAIDFQIITEISRFSVNAQTGVADVVINANLLNDRNGTVIASRRFEGTSRVGGSGNDAFVAGLDRAFSDVIDELVNWVADRI